mmetsp:Transcript_14811/g.36188  ORF Transcript_14811/g.36188 Transcript_14811/m.36188 type:complete len:140 (+) Transcript_14811:1506-1925(+)
MLFLCLPLADLRLKPPARLFLPDRYDLCASLRQMIDLLKVARTLRTAKHERPKFPDGHRGSGIIIGGGLRMTGGGIPTTGAPNEPVMSPGGGIGIPPGEGDRVMIVMNGGGVLLGFIIGDGWGEDAEELEDEDEDEDEV